MPKSDLKKVVSAIFLCVAQQATAWVGDGNLLATEAEAYMKNDNPVSWGLFAGKVAGVASVYSIVGSGRFAICYPENVTSGQLSKITAKFLRENPAELHKGGDYLIWKSHLDVFGLQALPDCEYHDEWLSKNK